MRESFRIEELDDYRWLVRAEDDTIMVLLKYVDKEGIIIEDLIKLDVITTIENMRSDRIELFNIYHSREPYPYSLELGIDVLECLSYALLDVCDTISEIAILKLYQKVVETLHNIGFYTIEKLCDELRWIRYWVTKYNLNYSQEFSLQINAMLESFINYKRKEVV